MNKEELFNAIDEKIKQKFGCYIWTKEVNELVELAQQYADAQTSELKAEIERLQNENQKLQYSDAMNGVHLYELQCGISLFKTISEALTYELKNDLDSLMDSCSLSGEVEIVKEENVPTDNIQNEDFGIFKDIRIDQWSVGDSGDSFAGFVYARIDHKDKKTWIKVPYSC